MMKFLQMVATNEGAAGAGADMEAGTVLSKVRQTLSSGLMNAQHQGQCPLTRYSKSVFLVRIIRGRVRPAV